MQKGAKQWHFMRTFAPQEMVPHIKPRSFLSKVFKVAEQNSRLLLLYQTLFNSWTYIHYLTTYSMFFPNAFPLFSGFLFQNNHLLLQKNSSKPAPFQRHSKSLYAAAKLECELRHCGHLLRCSDLTKGTGSCGIPWRWRAGSLHERN